MIDVTPRRGPYRARHETEHLLLDAGLEVISEGYGSGALDRITAKDIAEAAGVSTGAIYSRWDSLEDYQRDLLIYRLQRRDSRSPTNFIELFEQLDQNQTEGNDLILVLTPLDFEHQRKHPAWGPVLVAWCLRADEVILEALRARYRKVRDSNEYLSRAAMDFAGRRMRNGLEQQDLTVALTALVDGLTLRSHVSPETTNITVPWPPEAEHKLNWPLVAVGADALVRYFTEPVDGPETREVWEPRTI